MTEIKTTLGALVEAEPALTRVLAVRFDKPDGARVRYHAAKLARLVTAETRHFYDDRDALIAKHGGHASVAGPAAPNNAQFLKDVAEVAAVPVTIPWGPLTSTMLDPYPDVTAADMCQLGPLCELIDPAPPAAT